MKQRKTPAIILIIVLLFAVIFPGTVLADEEEGTIQAVFDCGFGYVDVTLKEGFDFLKQDSSYRDWELALTGVTLSGHIYNDTAAEDLLLRLGYDYADTKPSNDRKSEYKHPAATFGYKRLKMSGGREANLFAVVVRGTQNNPTDIGTDILDGALSMFRDCGVAVRSDLFDFMERATGKKPEEVKKEENYFFLTGHSLGGATANYLSIDSEILKFANNDKGRIYTWTFSSPHTSVNLWWTDPESESNAFNIKDVDDFVTHMPPYPGSTTYGKDLTFGVNDLDDEIFKKLFPKAKGGSVLEAPKVTNYSDAPWGHHDRGLCLVYILQHGIADGTWKDLKEASDYERRVTIDKEIMPLFSMNYGEVKSSYGGTFEHVRGPLYKNLIDTSLGLDFSFYFSPEAEASSGAADWENAYFNEWDADPVRSVSGPANRILSGIKGDLDYRDLAGTFQPPEGYTLTSDPVTEVTALQSNADPDPTGYQYSIHFGLDDGYTYTISSTDTKIIRPETRITLVREEKDESSEAGPSGSDSGSSPGSTDDSSSGGEDMSAGEDVSAYGIPNGTYRSTDGFNQEFTFFGTDGIRMEVFGISAEGTYELRSGRIIVSYDFFGQQVWDTTFSMNGDYLYIAGTAFYKQ